MWKWAINFPQCLHKCLGVVRIKKKRYYLINAILNLPERCQKENKVLCCKERKKNFYTHDQPSSILELHSVIVHSDFELLRSLIMWPVFFTAVVTAVLVIVVILFVAVAVVFFAAAILVVIAVTVIMSAATIVALDVDVLEVIWQIPGLDKHIWVLSFIVVTQSVEGSIISLSVSVSLYFTLIEACEGKRREPEITFIAKIWNTFKCRHLLHLLTGSSSCLWHLEGRRHCHCIPPRLHIQSLHNFVFFCIHISRCSDLCTNLHWTGKKQMWLQLGLWSTYTHTHTHAHTNTFWQSCSDFKDNREKYLKIHIVCKFLCKHSHTWYFLPLLSTHPHCSIATQILPLCTNPSSHAHPCVQGWLSLQPGGPFRYSQVGLHAGRQVV